MKKKQDIKPDWLNSIARFVFGVLVVLLACWLFVGCSHDSDDLPKEQVTQVLLVYLAGDNSLSSESYDKLEAIRRGYNPTDHSRVLVYHDAQNASPYLSEVGGECIETYEAENSADPVVFSRVITQAKSLYPQASFNLLAFSHASGWLPANTLASPRSVFVDGNQQMELTDFAAAIPEGMFNCIFFEACFMAGIETAYQLKGKTRYIAASSAEIISPGFTDIYQGHVNELLEDDPREFMQAAFRYFDSQVGFMRSATFSITDTRELDALAAYVHDSCDLKREVPIESIQHFDRYNFWLFCDFGDYYCRLLNKQMQKQELQTLIDNVVIWKEATPNFMLQYGGFDIQKHSGMTAYIKQERYPILNQSYESLSWYKRINQ